MTEDMRKDFIANYKRHAERIQRFFDMNAPEAILASEVLLMFKMSLGYLGQDLASQIAVDVVLPMRHYIGRCRKCCEKLANRHEMREGLCTDCEGKQVAQEFVAEVEYGGES